jgi:hypothetical protein
MNKFEFDLTRSSFIFGLSWENDYSEKWFAVIIGCFVFRFNIKKDNHK